MLVLLYDCTESVYVLSAGDVIFLTPLVVHSLDHRKTDPVAVYDVVRLDMEQFGDLPSYSPDMRGMMLEGERLGFPMMLTARELHDSHMDFTFNACMDEYRSRGYGYDLRIRSMLYLLFTSLIRRWIAAGFVPQNYSSRIDPIYTLPYYIARNIQDPLKVEELSLVRAEVPPDLRHELQGVYREDPDPPRGTLSAVHRLRPELHQPAYRICRLQPPCPRFPEVPEYHPRTVPPSLPAKASGIRPVSPKLLTHKRKTDKIHFVRSLQGLMRNMQV